MGNLLLEVGDSTIIHVTVRDVLGNLCGQPSTVLFEIINGAQPPAGASFNDGVLIDSTVTSNGVGIIRFNVGQSTDGALIHATTWADEERTQSIEAIFSTGRVYPGPPFGIDIDVNDDGEDAGGGAWSIEVAARVWDRYRNPVRDGTPVYFNVDPIQRNAVAVFTDNGIADFSLIYNSVNTFDPIVVNAWADSPEGEVRSRREHILPLQEGYLELNVEPANWMFEDDTTIAEIRCWVDLKDGHQIEINNAPILFTSNRRALYWYDFATDQYVGFFLDPAIAYTGIVNRQHNEEPGQATIWLRGYYDDLVDWIWPYTPVQINAQVIGYDDVTADPAFIFITRRGGR